MFGKILKSNQRRLIIRKFLKKLAENDDWAYAEADKFRMAWGICPASNHSFIAQIAEGYSDEIFFLSHCIHRWCEFHILEISSANSKLLDLAITAGLVPIPEIRKGAVCEGYARWSATFTPVYSTGHTSKMRTLYFHPEKSTARLRKGSADTVEKTSTDNVRESLIDRITKTFTDVVTKTSVDIVTGPSVDMITRAFTNTKEIFASRVTQASIDTLRNSSTHILRKESTIRAGRVPTDTVQQVASGTDKEASMDADSESSTNIVDITYTDQVLSTRNLSRYRLPNWH